MYLRNGPNPLFDAVTNRGHFFDGDSMVHAIRIKDGKMYYCNRYLKTPRYFCEKKANEAVFVRLGELSSKIGLTKAMLIGLQ